MKQAATAALLCSINRLAILNLFGAESPFARTEIARQLNMSLSSVMQVVKTLIVGEHLGGAVPFESAAPNHKTAQEV